MDIKYWYFTAEVFRVSKNTNEVLESKSFSSMIWSSSNPFFPIQEAIKITTITVLDRDAFFNQDTEYCPVRIINQIEISKVDAEMFTDGLGMFKGGGQLV